MKRKTICLLATLALSVSLAAQRRGNAADNTAAAEQYIAQYRFDEAEELLDKLIAALRKKRQPTAREEQLLDAARKGAHMMDATEKVTFVDSVVADKAAFLDALRISPESGQLFAYGAFFNREDKNGCTVYRSELGNKIYFSQPDRSGTLRLYTSDLIDKAWTSPQPLEGLDGDDAQNYPFMLSDGVTLYYAARGEESFGGYDIFVSRYDTDGKTFLRPENIGMPFNSAANDYMYAIDEVNNLGWFVSDRFQPEGKVCIYVFIPNEVREVYDAGDAGEAKLRRLARVTSIAETWTDTAARAAARARLEEARSERQASSARRKDFEFVINDRLTYTLAEDFKSPAARKLIGTWKAKAENLQRGHEQLQALRDIYADADKKRKAQLATQVRTMEASQEKLDSELKQMEKNIRNEENAFLSKPNR